MKEFNYAQKAAELAKVLDALQSPTVDIDEAIKLHTQGIELVAELESYLKTAENTVKKHVK